MVQATRTFGFSRAGRNLFRTIARGTGSCGSATSPAIFPGTSSGATFCRWCRITIAGSLRFSVITTPGWKTTSRGNFAAASHWRQINNADDSKAVAMIRQDGIDVLVDLSLHLGHNRLTVFARKPAPVQATFAGYPGTTGLDAIDYRLTDPLLDPPGQADAFYSEESIRLGHSFWCYDPAAMHPAEELPVAPLPGRAGGAVTFGCLNNFRKVNDGVLNLWSNVLRAVPESRLILLAPPGNSRRRVLDRLGLGRVEFVDRQDRAAYLKTCDRIDVGLDTFPYNGHATSLDCLWMGVPVVTLMGRTVRGTSRAVTIEEPRARGTGCPDSGTVRADRRETGGGFGAAGGIAPNVARADAGVAADGCAVFCAGYRSGVPADVAELGGWII